MANQNDSKSGSSSRGASQDRARDENGQFVAEDEKSGSRGGARGSNDRDDKASRSGGSASGGSSAGGARSGGSTSGGSNKR